MAFIWPQTQAANSAWLLAGFLAVAWGEPLFAPHVSHIKLLDAASALSGAAIWSFFLFGPPSCIICRRRGWNPFI
jgi:hypothetical protein